MFTSTWQVSQHSRITGKYNYAIDNVTLEFAYTPRYLILGQIISLFLMTCMCDQIRYCKEKIDACHY